MYIHSIRNLKCHSLINITKINKYLNNISIVIKAS